MDEMKQLLDLTVNQVKAHWLKATERLVKARENYRSLKTEVDKYVYGPQLPTWSYTCQAEDDDSTNRLLNDINETGAAAARVDVYKHRKGEPQDSDYLWSIYIFRLPNGQLFAYPNENDPHKGRIRVVVTTESLDSLLPKINMIRIK